MADKSHLERPLRPWAETPAPTGRQSGRVSQKVQSGEVTPHAPRGPAMAAGVVFDEKGQPTGEVKPNGWRVQQHFSSRNPLAPVIGLDAALSPHARLEERKWTDLE